MLFSYNWLKDYLNFKLSPEDIKMLLMSFSPLEVEFMEKRGDDTIFDIKILANRMSDCASHYGLAREINALAKIKGFKKIVQGTNNMKKKISFCSLKTSDYVDIVIESAVDCPYYGGVLMKLNTLSRTPEWILSRLNSVGVKPINPIVDLSNYILIDQGQPTHAFDLDKIFSKQKKKKIIIRRAKRGEKIEALDGKTYLLNPEILVIADEKKPIAIAGIKGGVASAVSSSTKTIFLEYAIFNPTLIYQASKKLGINSDASLRFSHSVFKETLDRSVNSFKKIAVASDIAYPSFEGISKGKFQRRQNKININLKFINQRLSLNLNKKQITNILSCLGCVVKIKNDVLQVIPPPFRMDLKIQEDLLEEIGRVVDFNSVPYEFLSSQIIPIEKNQKLENEYKIREILFFNCFDEIYTSSLIGEADVKYLIHLKKIIQLKNFLSSNHSYLRPSLMSGLLKTIQKNKDNFFEIKVFEIGNVFSLQKVGKSLKNEIQEIKSLAFVSYKNKHFSPLLAQYSDFYYVKKTLNDILASLNINYELSSIKQKNKDNTFFDLAFEIVVNHHSIGKIGYLKEEILKIHDIKGKVAACEINLNDILNKIPPVINFKPFSDYPKIVRDISFYVSTGITYQDIAKAIKSAKINFLEEFNLVDIYQKNNSEPLSLTMRFIFRNNLRTLKDSEVNQEKEKIEKMLIKKFQVKLR